MGGSKRSNKNRKGSSSTASSKTSTSKSGRQETAGDEENVHSRKDSSSKSQNEGLPHQQKSQARSDLDATETKRDKEKSVLESSKSPDLSTDAFGEPVARDRKSFESLFSRLVWKRSKVLPRHALHAALMKYPEESHALQQRYYQYREKKITEYCIHPVMDKNNFEKRICPSCAEGNPGQDFNISKKLLEEEVPDHVLEMISTDEDLEKEIKNQTNHLYQQHVLVNGFMAKLFGKSLGKSKAFCPKAGREELGKLHKLSKAYTLVVDVIHSMVTDNSLESWWQAFGAQQEDDEPSYEEIDFVNESHYEEIVPKGPLGNIKESDEYSSPSDEEIFANRKELDSMKIRLGRKIFEKK